MSRLCAAVLLLSLVAGPAALAREPRAVVARMRRELSIPSSVEKIPPGVLVAPCQTGCWIKENTVENPVLDWVKAAVAKLVA